MKNSRSTGKRQRRQKKEFVEGEELVDLGNQKHESTINTRRAAEKKWNRYLEDVVKVDPQSITAEIITETVFGQFADFLFKFDSPAYISAKNYLSSIKMKLCKDFPSLLDSIFDERRNPFYTNTHSNLRKLFTADAEAREQALVNKATPALPVHLNLYCGELFNTGQLEVLDAYTLDYMVVGRMSEVASIPKRKLELFEGIQVFCLCARFNCIFFLIFLSHYLIYIGIG